VNLVADHDAVSAVNDAVIANTKNANDQLNPLVRIGNIQKGKNPRKYFSQKGHEKMVASIRAQGVLTPILLRQMDDGSLVLIAGERRLRAANEVYGEDGVIPALIKKMTDEEAIAAARSENTDREDMSVTEESDSIAELVAELDGDRDEAAKMLGVSRATVDSRLALQHCTDAVKTALNERKIKLGHAELLAVAPKEAQDAVVKGVIEKNVSVDDLRKMLLGKTKQLATACFDKKDCVSCPHNSDQQMSLLETNVGSGFCTNWNCFDQKTNAHIQVIVDHLSEEVPNVRVVEAGDVRKFILLKVEGAGGVGNEQFEQGCKGCTNYGAAVLQVPGQEGEVLRNQCFDAACNTLKQAAYIESQKPKPEEAAPAKAVPAAKSSGTGKTAPAKKKATVTNTIPNKVEEYRIETWRRLIKNAISKDQNAAQVVLFALVADGNHSHISSTKIGSVWNQMYGCDKPHSLEGMLAYFNTAGAEKRDMTNGLIAATMVNSILKQKLPSIMAFLQIDMKKVWKITDKYLQLLTKSEIESLAAEIGLKEHLGGKFAKVMNNKRDEVIKQLMATEGFVFDGVIPKAMDYTTMLPNMSKILRAFELYPLEITKLLRKFSCK
jgi:ParB family chromosome partitioning protein